MSQKITGFALNGIFKPETGKQAAFITPSDPQLIDIFEADTGMSAVSGILPRSGSIETSVDPHISKNRHSSYSFRLPATDDIGKYFFRKSARAVAEVAETIPNTSHDGETEEELFLTVTPGEDLEEGIQEDGRELKKVYYTNDVPRTYLGPLYIGSETMYMRYDLSDDIQVVRGVAGSRVGQHKRGAQVYTEVPYWIGRGGIIFSYDPATRVFTTREVIQVADGFKQDKAELVIQLRSNLSGLDNAELNTDPLVNSNGVNFANMRSKVSKTYSSPVFFHTITTITEQMAEWQGLEKDTEFEMIMVYSAEPDAEAGYHTVVGMVKPNSSSFGAEFYGGSDVVPTMYEILYIGSPEDQGYTSLEAFDELTSSITTDQAVREMYKRHPLALCAAMMLSTNKIDADGLETPVDADNFDVLHSNLSLNLGHAFSEGSIQEIHDLIQATPTMQMEEFTLGWEGKLFKAMATIREILNTFGFRLVKDGEGYLKFTRMKLIDVGTLNNTPELTVLPSNVLSLSDGEGDQLTITTGTFGGGIPWNEPVSFNISTDPNANSPQNIQNTRGGSVNINARSIKNLSTLQALMVQRGLIQNFQAPRLKCRVPDYLDDDLDYSLGAFITIRDLPLDRAWLYNNNGQRITVENSEAINWTGQIIGRRYLPLQNIYEIELYFTQDAVIRWRTPSAIVSSITLLSGIVQLNLGSSFDVGENDATFFEIGDQILLYNRDGTLWDTTMVTVSAKGSNYIRMNNDFASDPVPGLVVELANIDTNDNADGFYNPGAILENIDRVYTFLGNSQGDIGTTGEKGDQNG